MSGMTTSPDLNTLGCCSNSVQVGTALHQFVARDDLALLCTCANAGQMTHHHLGVSTLTDSASRSGETTLGGLVRFSIGHRTM